MTIRANEGRRLEKNSSSVVVVEVLVGKISLHDESKTAVLASLGHVPVARIKVNVLDRVA